MNNRDLVLAAGAVVWRPGPDGPEILLVHRPKYDDWSLPKGKRDPGEHMLVTAVREVREETGVRPVLGPRLRTVSYLARGVPKRVDYWVATTTDEAKASHEVDEVAWVPASQAGDRLDYERDQDTVASLVPVRTVPLIIVRHASAGPKTAPRTGLMQSADLSRTLDAKGRRDAAALTALLASFAPRARVISSPALRCTDTMRPYAVAAGVDIEEDQDLITTGDTSSEPLIRALVRASQPAIVCVHRENMPVAVGAACSALGADPPPDPTLPKGGFWVIHMKPGEGAAGEVAGIERHALLRLTTRYVMYAASSTASAMKKYSAYRFTSA